MMHENSGLIERAILVGVHTGRANAAGDATEESMAELARLAETADIETLATVLQNRHAPDPATYIGEGKIDEIKTAAQELGANLIIFDDELSSVQARNLSNALDIKVIDRTMLILDIFASRAISKEGKIQVELAQLQYLLPRLAGMGVSLSRLGGGIGTRGPGETKLETDRRHIRRRIAALSKELDEIQRHRDLIRARRKKDMATVVALVGYTNSGKSSLLNLLTDANVLAEDKLFATLDSTHRALTLPDNRTVILVDTVGFIRKLPTNLIKAFRSTLEEAALADVLVHVIDASSAEYLQHISVVEQILSEIGAGGKPTVAVFNKIDLIDQDTILPKTLPGTDACTHISIKTREGIDELIALIERLTLKQKRRICALIPYSEGRLLAALHETQTVQEETFVNEGIQVCALVDPVMYGMLQQYLIDR